MSFFKDLKEDIAQSVNELTESFDDEDTADDGISVEELEIPDELPVDELPEPEPMPVESLEAVPVTEEAFAESETVETPDNPQAEIEAAQALLASGEFDVDEALDEAEAQFESGSVIPETETIADEPEPVIEPEPVPEPELIPEPMPEPEPIPAPIPEPVPVPEPEPVYEPVVQESVAAPVVEEIKEEKVQMSEELLVDNGAQETTIITKGTTINGSIKTDTALDVRGTIEGDVECSGELVITGRIAGNINASEIEVNTPRLEGDLNSEGNVRVQVGTVVIGGINSASAVVSGAVKGDIQASGPVVVDSTAVVKGNIKAKSIQINSGAVIDGACSMQFSDVDLDTFFE